MIISPCISICKTDPVTGYCYGCGRSIEDKRNWKDEKTSDKWKINNLQEIQILMRAQQVMKKEGQNPDDALAWVRGQMADDAGVDIEEFMPDFDWGDFPGKYSTGGGVGSMFRRV